MADWWRTDGARAQIAAFGASRFEARPGPPTPDSLWTEMCTAGAI